MHILQLSTSFPFFVVLSPTLCVPGPVNPTFRASHCSGDRFGLSALFFPLLSFARQLSFVCFLLAPARRLTFACCLASDFQSAFLLASSSLLSLFALIYFSRCFLCLTLCVSRLYRCHIPCLLVHSFFHCILYQPFLPTPATVTVSLSISISTDVIVSSCSLHTSF